MGYRRVSAGMDWLFGKMAGFMEKWIKSQRIYERSKDK